MEPNSQAGARHQKRAPAGPWTRSWPRHAPAPVWSGTPAGRGPGVGRDACMWGPDVHTQATTLRWRQPRKRFRQQAGQTRGSPPQPAGRCPAALPPTRRRAISLATPANSSASRSAALFCSRRGVGGEEAWGLGHAIQIDYLSGHSAGSCEPTPATLPGACRRAHAKPEHAAAACKHARLERSLYAAQAVQLWSPCRLPEHSTQQEATQGGNAAHLHRGLHFIHQRLDGGVRQPRAVKVLRRAGAGGQRRRDWLWVSGDTPSGSQWQQFAPP